MATAPQYSLEESLERACVSVLTGITSLAAITIVRGDASDEVPLPHISVRAERQEEVTPAMQTWLLRLSTSLYCPADKTTTDEIDARRYPEDEDDDAGEPGFAAYWKTLTDTLTASTFKTSLNAQEITYVWAVIWEPTTTANADRAFVRTANAQVWCNVAYPA